MFKFKYTKLTYIHAWFSVRLSTPWEVDNDRNIYNELSIYLGKHHFLITLPALIRPGKKWVDTTDAPWNKDKEGPSGFWNYIRKSYGFSFAPECLHIDYGIQPGQWISNDPANSDHSKVILYPWNLEHVRHDAYYLDGTFLCPGEHMHQYKILMQRAPKFKDWNDNEHRALWFQTLMWFPMPKSVEYAYVHKWKDEYNNWSNTEVDPSSIFKFYEYTDKYDNTTTVACVHIVEREWIRGKWKWLRSILQYVPGCVKTKRVIDIEFRNEVGRKKGSWKGGVIGTSCEMLPGETVDECWKRFCATNNFHK